jgi:hypothetical protein
VGRYEIEADLINARHSSKWKTSKDASVNKKTIYISDNERFPVKT